MSQRTDGLNSNIINLLDLYSDFVFDFLNFERASPYLIEESNITLSDVKSAVKLFNFIRTNFRILESCYCQPAKYFDVEIDNQFFRGHEGYVELVTVSGSAELVQSK